MIDDPVSRYADDVLANKIVAGKLVKQACERHFRNVDNQKDLGISFDLKAAERSIKFFSFLRHSKGEWANKPIELGLWQQFCQGSIFGWKRVSDGKRRFRTAWIEVAKKNGKSTWFSGNGVLLLVGDNEQGAEIYSAATKRDQARITHSEAIRMVRKSSALLKRVKIHKDSLTVPSTNSKFEPLGKDEDSTDGINVHGAIIDEVHRHKTRDMWDIIDESTAARSQPLILGITTAGVDQISIAREIHDRAVQILEGVLSDETLFIYIATIDDEDDWADPNCWIKANPNLGVSVNMEDLKVRCEKAKQTPAYLNSFLRYRMNRWTQQSVRYLPIEAWNKCATSIDMESLRGRKCYVGIDLAKRIDISSAVLLFPPEKVVISESKENPDSTPDGNETPVKQFDLAKMVGEFLAVPLFWIPKDTIKEKSRIDRVPYDAWVRDGLVEATEGNIIDTAFIEKKLAALSEVYEFVYLGFDPAFATGFSTSMIANYSLNMVEVKPFWLNEPTIELLRLILAKKLLHSGHPVLTWMANNLVVKEMSDGRIMPDKVKARQKIDGIVALIIALALTIRLPEPQPSVYEARARAGDGPIVRSV